MCCCCLVVKSCPTLFATKWIVAHQAPLCMGFPRQEYWSGLPFPSPGDLSDPEIKPTPPSLASWFLTTEPPGKPLLKITEINFISPTHTHWQNWKFTLFVLWLLHFRRFWGLCVKVSFPPTLLTALWGLLSVTALRSVRPSLSSSWSPLLCVSSAGGLTALFSESIIRWDIFAKAEQLRPQLVGEILTILRFPEFRGASQGAYINLFWDKKLCFLVNSKV